MGIIARFGDIISANINELLDKCEDPAKMVDQYLRNAQEDLAEVRQETAAIIAEEKSCRRNFETIKGEVEKYDALSRKALTAGEEEDCKKFLELKATKEQGLVMAEKNYTLAKANSKKMADLHDKLVKDIAGLQARRQNVKATMAVAKTQETVNKMGKGSKTGTEAISAFDRMEQKANAKLDMAEATSDLLTGSDDGVEDLENKYAGASVGTDDALAKLKAEMGIQ